jgi:membrane protein implicated in regulation of membrane protease activity
MWLLYLLSLVLAGGILLLQVLGSGDHGDAHHFDGGHGHEPGVISTRAAVYGLFAFGLVGAALHIPGLLAPGDALAFALASGAAAAVFAGWAFARLGSPAASGAASLEEAKGQRGRVLLPCAPERAGKVRVTLKGQTVDLRAVSEGGTIPAGADVLILDVHDDLARVVEDTVPAPGKD